MANEPNIMSPVIDDFGAFTSKGTNGRVFGIIGGPDGDDQSTQDDQPVGPEPGNPPSGAPETGGGDAPVER